MLESSSDSECGEEMQQSSSTPLPTTIITSFDEDEPSNNKKPPQKKKQQQQRLFATTTLSSNSTSSAKAGDDKKKKPSYATVRVSTFKGYDFANDFLIEEEAGQVKKAYCKPCTKHIAEIKSNVQTNSNIFKGVVKWSYVDGVTRIHKHNLIAHINGGIIQV